MGPNKGPFFMKKNKWLLALTIAALILVLWWLLGKKEVTKPLIKGPAPSIVSTPSPTAQTNRTTANPAVQSNDPCTVQLIEIANQYPLATLKSNHASELRMRNKHLQVDGEIYRLRQFYDDGDEGERLTYLVYIEDADEFATIIERSPYKKGSKYLELEKRNAQILFEEEAYSVEDLYMHYRNGKLIRAAGSFANSHLECAL